MNAMKQKVYGYRLQNPVSCGLGWDYDAGRSNNSNINFQFA